MTENHDALIAGALDEATVAADPIEQFQRWFKEAIEAGVPMPEAMTVATANREGKPSARMCLMKHVDGDGFVFFTNYRSAKARELEENPRVALVFWWTLLERQVRVEGHVHKTSFEESCEYFHTRPRESQIGAWASPQSDVIKSREVLEQRTAKVEEQYKDREVDCPEHWGGYRLRPERIEFWKGRVGRLHDRILYERGRDNAWSIVRLAP